MAASAVLDLPELLVQILSQLSFLDLRTLRRVNIKWRDIIMTSTLIRQQLFLEPVPGGVPLVNFHSLDRELSPARLDFFQTSKWKYVSNDLLAKFDTHPHFTSKRMGTRRLLYSVLQPHDPLQTAKIEQKYGTWINSYITQPPATFIKLTSKKYAGRLEYGGENVRFLAKSSGLTLKDLLWAVDHCFSINFDARYLFNNLGVVTLLGERHENSPAFESFKELTIKAKTYFDLDRLQ